MKIKRLYIHGFKSFVDKTNIVLASGASAIVGPNGCGKSNIVDAIRWVLGEQNARHLRGKDMQDIIFNGSEARKPLGMAEVVLTFSNEEGLAPAHFASYTEIEIARRLYRSGESEYFINKVPSRLRDIVELFTDTGIGTRAYSIIEQGQIGWLINAKPEERRVIFEEAAGINKFKHKKEAALRRMESARENLTRVSDIISEVKRQLNSLNRQAKKAERYKLLREELKALDLRLASLDYLSISEATAAAAKRLAAIKDEDLALFNEVAGAEAGADEIRNTYSALETEYKGVRERLFAFEKELQSSERASALATVRIDELGRNAQRLKDEIIELKRNRESGASDIERLGVSVSDSVAFIDGQKVKLDENATRLAAINEAGKAMDDERSGEAAEASRANARISELKHAIQTCMRDEDFMRVKESKAASVLNDAAKTLTRLEDEGGAIRHNLSGHAAFKGGIEAEMQTIKDRLASLEAEFKEKNVWLKDARGAHAGAAARLATLEEMERNFENLKGGAKSVMRAGNLQGLHGLLADCIETNPGYERAVEAALGDRLQYILVESHKEGVDAIEFLKNSKGGRGSFVPLRDARPVASPVAMQVAVSGNMGVREMLGEIRIKEGYGAIISGLLADTYIVDNLEGALAAWRENGSSSAFVTLDGETIDAQGVVTGGVSSGVDSGILQRRAEIKNIMAQAQELAEKTASLEAAIKEISRAIVETTAALGSCKDRLHAAEIKRVGDESSLSRLNEERNRFTKAHTEAERDKVDAVRRLAELAAKKTVFAEERAGIEDALTQRDARIAALGTELARMAEKKEEVSKTVTEIKISLAQAHERVDASSKEIAAKERHVADIDGRISAKEREIESGGQEASLRGEEVAVIKLRLDELLAQADTIRKDEVSMTERLGDLATGMKAAESGLKELKARSAALQNLKVEVSMSLNELELSLNNLREKTFEKYGVAIDTYTEPSIEPVAAAGEGEAVESADTGAEAEKPHDGLDRNEMDVRRSELRDKIFGLGEVSLGALEEYNELERRYQFLVDQQADLQRSVDALMSAITRINRTTRDRFAVAFEEINARFKETFPKFFNGGRAELRLAEEADVLEAGVEIVAQPPGKRLQNITLLSGGEKALTATALIFAIFLTKPSPFCLLDEVDAPLDDANIDRFNAFVKEMSMRSQFILITHNKKTMEMADALHGITMEEPGISKTISVRF